MNEPRRSYFVMIPRIVLECIDDPYAVRLYLHLRAVAGEDGACWQSTDTLRKACRFSKGKVSECKRILADAGFIRIEKRRGRGGTYDWITVTDVWDRNHAHFADDRRDTPQTRDRAASVHAGEVAPARTSTPPGRTTEPALAHGSPAPATIKCSPRERSDQAAGTTAEHDAQRSRGAGAPRSHGEDAPRSRGEDAPRSRESVRRSPPATGGSPPATGGSPSDTRGLLRGTQGSPPETRRSHSEQSRSRRGPPSSPGEPKKIPLKRYPQQQDQEEDPVWSLERRQQKRHAGGPPEAADWDVVLEGLKGMMPFSEDYRTLFAPTRMVGVADDGAWRVAVPGPDGLQAVERPRNRMLLTRGLRYAGFPDVEVRYEVRDG